MVFALTRVNCCSRRCFEGSEWRQRNVAWQVSNLRLGEYKEGRNWKTVARSPRNGSFEPCQRVPEVHRRELGRSVFVPVQQSCNRLSLEEKRRSRATMELTSWQLEMMGKKERGVWKGPSKTFELQVGNLQELDIISEPPKTSLLIAKVSGLLGFPGLRQQRGRREIFRAFGAFHSKKSR